MSLTLVGLGLWDHRDISMRGIEAVQNANAVYFDCYTSRLIGTTIEELAGALGVKITIAGREELEARVMLLKEIGGFEDLDTDLGRINIHDLERRVQQHIEAEVD